MFKIQKNIPLPNTEEYKNGEYAARITLNKLGIKESFVVDTIALKDKVHSIAIELKIEILSSHEDNNYRIWRTK